MCTRCFADRSLCGRVNERGLHLRPSPPPRRLNVIRTLRVSNGNARTVYGMRINTPKREYVSHESQKRAHVPRGRSVFRKMRLSVGLRKRSGRAIIISNFISQTPTRYQVFRFTVLITGFIFYAVFCALRI